MKPGVRLAACAVCWAAFSVSAFAQSETTLPAQIEALEKQKAETETEKEKGKRKVKAGKETASPVPKKP